jgi:transposase
MSRLAKVFVGIDYHTRFCTVCVMDHRGEVLGSENCASEADFIVRYVRWVCQKEVQVQAAIEVCGGAAQMADKLRQRGWRVDLAHSGYVSNLKQSPDKTDKQDAELLADLVRVGYLPRVWLAPERLRQLRSLVRFRQQLIASQRRTKLRIRALLREAGLKLSGRGWTVAWLGELQTQLEELGSVRAWICRQHLAELKRLAPQIAEIEQRLGKELDGDAEAAKLLAQPGVGLVTAATLLAEIGDFRRFARGKQLARYCGTAPINHSTGGKGRDLGLGRQCNRELRRVIIEAAHRLARYVPRWRTLKEKLKSNGKSGAEAAAAVANRWIRRLHYEMTHTMEETGQAA